MAAPLPTPTGVVRIRLVHSPAAESGEFGCAFDQAYTGPAPNNAALNSLATEVVSAWTTHLASVLTDALQLVRVSVIDLANPGTPDGIATASVTGTRTGVNNTYNICAQMQYTIGDRYRGAKPKTFTPYGVLGDTSDPRTWKSDFITELTTKWTAFIAELNGFSFGSATLGGQVGVRYTTHPYTLVPNSGNTRAHARGTPLDPPQVYPVITTSVAPKLGSQRKRLGKPF
jgi:hypothetical protein